MSGTVHTIDLPNGLEAASVARAFVTKHTTSLPSEVIDDALICVSELVSNAVLHGQPTITLDVRTTPPGIGVAVTDHGHNIPDPPDKRPEVASTRGRGLYIVSVLAEAWGITSNLSDSPVQGASKTVWFELHA